jgi:hypothetical protein
LSDRDVSPTATYCARLRPAGEEVLEIVEFLSPPSTHGGYPVGRIETHASIVFLAGERALKLKRAVRYDCLDFSTADRRRAMCDAEVRIDRRTAPSLYRRVLVVTRQPDGSLRLGRSGVPVEWVIERFEQNDLLDRRAERGALPIELMRPLSAGIALTHHSMRTGSRRTRLRCSPAGSRLAHPGARDLDARDPTNALHLVHCHASRSSRARYGTNRQRQRRRLAMPNSGAARRPHRKAPLPRSCRLQTPSFDISST